MSEPLFCFGLIADIQHADKVSTPRFNLHMDAYHAKSFILAAGFLGGCTAGDAVHLDCSRPLSYGPQHFMQKD